MIFSYNEFDKFPSLTYDHREARKARDAKSKELKKIGYKVICSSKFIKIYKPSTYLLSPVKVKTFFVKTIGRKKKQDNLNRKRKYSPAFCKSYFVLGGVCTDSMTEFIMYFLDKPIKVSHETQ